MHPSARPATARRVVGRAATLAVLAMVWILPPALQAQSSTTLTGVITDATGRPVAGALVKVQDVKAGLTFLVVSRGEGRYTTPILPAGEYRVQGFGGGYQSVQTGPVALARAQQERLDLILSTSHQTAALEKVKTNADYARLMPEGSGRELILNQCVLCHGLDRVVPTRHTRQEWRHTVDRMRAFFDERSDLQQQMGRGPFSDQEEDLIWNYLSRHFGMETPRLPRKGAPDPNEHFPKQLLQGAQANFVAMELQLPSNRNEYEIGIDSQGIAWVSERETAFFGRFDPNTFTYTRLSPPPEEVPRLLAQLAVDPRDHIWILDNRFRPKAELLEYAPKTQAFKNYEIPAPVKYGSAPLNTIRFLDGDVWGPGNVSNRIVKLGLSTGKITEYPVPKGSHPYGIAVGQDKMVYYVAMYDDEVVQLNPQTGQMKPFKVPTRHSGLRRMGADSEGNLWVGAQNSDKLVKVDPLSGKVSEYAVPTPGSGPYTADVDPTRDLIWYTLRNLDWIGRFDPHTNTFTEFPLVTAGTRSRRILVDPSNPNRIWFGGRKIGYIEVIDSP